MNKSEYMKLIYRYHNDIDIDLYKCTSSYSKVKHPMRWLVCDVCGLIPRVNEFDNGRRTGCGCGDDEYNHFSVSAECITSVMRNSHNGQSMLDYDTDGLRKNWNAWVKNKVLLFPNTMRRKDKRY